MPPHTIPSSPSKVYIEDFLPRHHHLRNSSLKAMARGPPFALLPSELTLNIFCQLSSFTDVFALAGTCRGLRQIYSAYTTLIYSRVAPRSIACESYARRFLIDQDGGPAIGSPFSVADMLRVAKNSSVVEKAIRQFEKEIVSRVRSKS